MEIKLIAEKEKILITGAEGFFASRFIEFYKDKFHVIAYNRNQMDITDETETIAAIKKISPRYVIHAAAIADTKVCEENPELSYVVNVMGTINVAKACLSSKAKLIFLSSDQVYSGNLEGGPYSEDCRPLPNNVYGRHKLQAEGDILELLEEVVVLRLTWLFGLPEKDKRTNSNIIWNIARAAMNNKSLRMPANEYRGITYIYELLGNFEQILKLSKGIYNTGSENALSTCEIAELVINEMGLKERSEEILIKDTERYKLNHRDLRINNEKLRKRGIYFPCTCDSIKRCIDEFSFKI